ncbi:MAG TPA: hypothetical protein VOB72_13580 [Candidatus Dormibacteraeota bacterium]|nr:hypothetical protein [Candidatus Dormibacteraeota bacterium]
MGPFSGLEWPPTGEWCGRGGVSGCRRDDLPYWIHDTLWVLELRGPIVEEDVKVVGADGRLVGRVEAWDGGAALAFAADCALRMRDLAAGELRRAGHPDAAARLRRARSPKAIAALAPDLADDRVLALPRRVADLVGYAGDAAECAALGQAAAAAYVSARAHQAAGTPYLVERGRQAAWLAVRLNLE